MVAALALTSFLVGFHLGPIFAIAQTVARPSMRALASAIILLTATCFGQGVGPLAVGMINDALKNDYGVNAVRMHKFSYPTGQMGIGDPNDSTRMDPRGMDRLDYFVTGIGTDGAERSVYLYHVADNEQTMREYGCQAVVWQTAINPVIALELLADGSWKATGVLGPEALDADVFLARMQSSGWDYGVSERSSANVV
jgi:hypothetical protein